MRIKNLIYISGMFGRADLVFYPVWTQFRRLRLSRGCREYFWSLKGHERPHRMEAYSTETYIEDLLSKARDVEGPSLIIGHSYGGHCAKILAEFKELNIVGVVSIASAPPPGILLPPAVQWAIIRNPRYQKAMWMSEVFKLERRDADWLMLNELTSKCADQVFNYMTPESGRLLWEIAIRQFLRKRNTPPQFPGQIIEISGKEDYTIPSYIGQNIVRSLRNQGKQNVRQQTIAGGHFSILKNPDILEIALQEFDF